MALMDFIKKQFIDVIQWTEDDGETMAWRFPVADMEIQNGASLTVRESQMALFVDEGHLAIHNWPELGAVTLDLYVCNFSRDNRDAAESAYAQLLQAFQPASVGRRDVSRGNLAS